MPIITGRPKGPRPTQGAFAAKRQINDILFVTLTEAKRDPHSRSAENIFGRAIFLSQRSGMIINRPVILTEGGQIYGSLEGYRNKLILY